MGSAKKTAGVILLIMFIVGALIAITGFIRENTVSNADPEYLEASNQKVFGVILMVIPAAIFMGISSGTGRPYGGKRYKGLGGY
jgi:hypothetical protein